jgi:hypothetical protein
MPAMAAINFSFTSDMVQLELHFRHCSTLLGLTADKNEAQMSGTLNKLEGLQLLGTT